MIPENLDERLSAHAAKVTALQEEWENLQRAVVSKPGASLLLSPAEAARYLGVGRNFLYGLIHSGEIPHLKVGQRKIMIPRQACDDWVQGKVDELRYKPRQVRRA